MKDIQYKVEACVENLEEAILAESKGADQIELCADLSVGGVTPSKAIIQQAKEQLQLKIKVMIRPRGGDFTYSYEELEKMKQAILYCKSIGIDGVVFGILQEENQLNIDQILTLARLAAPMEVTIHRAIDEVPDILKAIAQLKAIRGVHAVLSAGKAEDAATGADTLAAMCEIAGEALDVIPGGGVTLDNVENLHAKVGARVYHGTRIVGPLKASKL